MTSVVDDFIRRARLKSDYESRAAILQFLQLNCHRSITPSVNLDALITSSQHQTTIGLLQEPCFNDDKIKGFGDDLTVLYHTSDERPRAAIVLPKSLSINTLPLNQFTDRDIVSTILANPASRKSCVIISSVYWAHDSNDIPLTLTNLIQFSSNKNIPIIIGADVNAHNTSWGSTNTNVRGRILEDFLSTTNLTILNNSTHPTYQNSIREEVIDISLSSNSLVSHIDNWCVLDTPSYSDHNIISFSVSFPHKVITREKRIKNTNWIYFEELCNSNSSLFSNLCFIPDLDTKVEKLHSLIIHFWEQSCPTTFIKNRSAVPWYKPILRTSRRKHRQLRRVANKRRSPNSWNAWRIAKNRHNTECRNAQYSAWKERASSLNPQKFSHIYKKLKKNHAPASSIQKADGTYTFTHEETLLTIIDTLTSSETANNITTNLTTNVFSPSYRNLDRILKPSVLNNIIINLPDFKSPGPDNLYNIMIKKAWSHIHHLVIDIFRQSLSTGSIPLMWQHSTAILIEKFSPPKSPSSFRIINLSCSLLKILERCILAYLQDSLHIHHSIHQFGFKTGSSTELALHHLMEKLQPKIAAKTPTIGIFIDLKSAFDNITFSSITTSLRQRNVPDYIINWVENYISHRYVTFTLGPYSTTRLMLKGSPQGGILSPFFFNLDVDSLLQILNALDEESIQGYADDLTDIISDPFFTNLHARAQQHLDIINTWAKSMGLSINILKTKIILFTNRRNITLPPLLVENHPLPYVTSTKFLGIHIDNKLNFNTHIDHIHKSSLTKFNMVKSFIGKKWGLTPSKANFIFHSMIRPSLAYGSIIWNQSLSTSRRKDKILSIDSKILQNITRAFKSTPTHVLYTLTNTSPSDFYILQCSILSLYRLAAQPTFTMTPSLDYLAEYLSSLHFPAPGKIDLIPCYSNTYSEFTVTVNHNLPIETFNNLDLYSQTPPSTLNIFTDGSRIKETTSAGYIIYSAAYFDPPIAGKIHMSSLNSVFQAEAMAIHLALSNHVSSNIDPNTIPLKINIFTDSQAVLKSLSKPKNRSSTIQSLIHLLNHLGSLHTINLYWIPGHNNIKGNEEADFLARSAPSVLTTYNNITCTTANVPPPLSYIKKRLKIIETITIKNRTTTSRSTNELKSLVHLLANSKTLPKTFKNLDTLSLRLLTHVISGHSHLNYFKSKLDPSISPICHLCNLEPETSLHYLGRCPYYCEFRLRIFNKLYIDLKDLYSISVTKLILFIKQSGRFSDIS